MSKNSIVEKKCFTICLGEAPILFIHNSIFQENTILCELPMKSYEGEFFYYTDTNDVHGCLQYDEKLGYKLNLMSNKELILSSLIDVDCVEAFSPETPFLCIYSSILLSPTEFKTEIPFPYTIKQIYEWVRKKEKDHNLEEGDIEGLIMGLVKSDT